MHSPRRSAPGLAVAAVLVAAAGIVSLEAGRAIEPPAPAADVRRAEATALMARSLVSIKTLRLEKGLPLDRALDPNGTGIVGEEFTPLTTSLGDVAAKRTAANPAFAGVVATYFERAGLRSGDVVAIGGSGSFPAFVLASLCAARALDLRPVLIYSIGASMYGANIPGFTFIEMLARLRADGVLPYSIAAVAPGGEHDSGRGVLFDEDGTTLVDEARRSGLPLVEGATLASRIVRRLEIYDAAAGGKPIRCFVNVGGATANYGDTEASLDVPNGLLPALPSLPASPSRGLIFEFAARGIPVVHLLYVKGLARANGLPFDPVPFPPLSDASARSR
ncbi:MAG: poly-gamma-glutamate system protein [Rhodospirillaceae bacterium]